MRVFASLGAYGHLYPMMPLALACRNAGHDVVVATGAPFADDLELPTTPGFPEHLTLQWAVEETKRRYPEAGDDFPVFMFGDVTAGEALPMALDTITTYQPDLIVYEPAHVAFGVAADLLDVPAAVFGIGLATFFIDVIHTRVPQFHAAVWRDHGRPAPPAAMLGRVLVDPVPPGLRLSGELPRMPIRSRAYGPPGLPAPDWLRRPSGRPRVYVTLGTVSFGAVDVLRRAVVESADADAEVLVAIGPDGDPAALGSLPPTVHLERFVSQAEVMPLVDLIIHHGGSGTVLGALEVGIPQVIMPQGADQFHNADLIGQHGAGRVLANDAYQSGVIKELTAALVGECAERTVAGSLQQEIRSMPEPSTVVEQLPSLLASG